MDKDKLTLLRDVASGKVLPEKALEALEKKPKRGRPRKYTGMYALDQDGKPLQIITPAMAKAKARETPEVLTIGKHYVDQVDSGIRPLVAMRNTLKQYHSKESPIEDSTVRKYATLWRKRRERDLIRQKSMLEAIRKGMEALNATTEENDDMP